MASVNISAEQSRTTRTVRIGGKRKAEAPKSTTVSVAPHTRIINGKSVQVGGYSYTRKG